ncbi:MAG: glycosyltransferase family 39 protein [Candidatus Eremiobacteraeota bacterium]|nr:glycosyltransferase family 39 protein [Candidatus Eremiobacteraeota bacterium]
MTTRTIPWIAAALVLIVHLIGNPHYGFFRDELYFIICGFHPQFGYVDQPPLVPLLAAGSQLFGHSLFLLRAVPAIFGAAGAYVTCLLVAEMGGGVFAQVLASLVFLFSGVLMSFGMKVSTDEVNLFTWPLLALLLARIAKSADARLWLAVGAIAGITVESKYSVLFLFVALAIGLLLTPQRRILWGRWFVAGVALAIAIVLPNLLWQAHYGFPMWELLRAGQDGKNLIAGPLLYIAQEILITGLFTFPVWVIGLIWLLRNGTLRFLGYAYAVLIVEMLLFHGKHYYPAAVYPILMAAGAVWIEAWTQRVRPVRIAVLAYTLALGPLFIPFALPMLPEPLFIAYQSRLGNLLDVPKTALATEHGRELSALPGDWADMHGWPEMAAQIQSVYEALPASDRAQAVVVASNYGEAAAVGFFTPNVPVISAHNQYWLWGTRGYSGNVVIDVNGDCGAKEHLFRSARRAATFRAPYTIGWETDVPIMVCRGINVPLATLWPQLKKYE